MIKVGIVILNYKTYKETIRLTNHLLSFSIRENLHIVIVDNLSPNESFLKLKGEFDGNSNVDVISANSNGGFAKGNNIGLRYLDKYDPEYALILNNDIYFAEDVLKKCIFEYERIPNVGVVSPIQYLPNGEIASLPQLKCNSFFDDLGRYSLILSKYKKTHKYSSNTKWPNIQQTDIIPGCFIFISYKLFKNINFFYEGTFLFCEERFLYKKLDEIDRKNYTILDCFYIHDHSYTINKEVKNNKQQKFLLEGVIEYTKIYRKAPTIKILILKMAFKINRINKIILRKFIKRH